VRLHYKERAIVRRAGSFYTAKIRHVEGTFIVDVLILNKEMSHSYIIEDSGDSLEDKFKYAYLTLLKLVNLFDCKGVYREYTHHNWKHKIPTFNKDNENVFRLGKLPAININDISTIEMGRPRNIFGNSQ
jgi:hypothetical protein